MNRKYCIWSGMRSMLERQDDRYQKVMIVGHNPAMTNFMNLLDKRLSPNDRVCENQNLPYSPGEGRKK